MKKTLITAALILYAGSVFALGGFQDDYIEETTPVGGDAMVMEYSDGSATRFLYFENFVVNYLDTIYYTQSEVDALIPTEASLGVDDLKTLSGVSGGSVNLGTFTGTTIADNQNNKQAMQALETAVEGVAGGHDAVTLNASATVGGMSLLGQDISNRAATNAQNGYATAAQITAQEANTVKVTNATHTGDVTGATSLEIAAGVVGSTELASTTVTPGSYTAADITVDADGRVTAASSGGGSSGDVVGPASATDNAVPRYSTTTGKLIQGSGVIIDDSNNVTGVVNLSFSGELTSSGSDGSRGIILTDNTIETSIVTNQLYSLNDVLKYNDGLDQIVVLENSTNIIDSDHYIDGSIDTAHIASSQITNSLMADNSIDTAELVDDAVGTAELSNTLDINTTGTIQGRLVEVIKTSDATLTLAEIRSTFITNYGETDDADLILTSPDIDESIGNSFIYTIVTAMSTNDTCFKASTDNLINFEGAAGADNGCVCNDAPALGDELACYNVTIGSGVSNWFCKGLLGTWAAVADNTGDCPN